MVFAGAMLGVFAVSYVPADLLRQIMPVLLVLVAGYFALSPKLSVGTFPIAVFSFFVAPLLGFYDGVFGPGTGSFFMLALVSLFGFGVVEATGRTKLLNFTSNIAALSMFILGGKIVWVVGLCMGIAQIVGAQIGARVAIANGARVIRPLLVLVCCAMAMRLWWVN